VEFSEEMVMLDPINAEDIKFWMTGPLSGYKVTITSYFESPTILKINVLSNTPFTGVDTEYLHLKFSSAFMSTNNVNLENEEVKGRTNKIPISPDVVAVIGTSSNTLMVTVLAGVITSNMILGGSSTLMWGFLNTIQIFYFLPLMSHYLPEHLKQFLIYLSAANMDYDIFGIKERFPILSSPEFDHSK